MEEDIQSETAKDNGSFPVSSNGPMVIFHSELENKIKPLEVKESTNQILNLRMISENLPITETQKQNNTEKGSSNFRALPEEVPRDVEEMANKDRKEPKLFSQDRATKKNRKPRQQKVNRRRLDSEDSSDGKASKTNKTSKTSESSETSKTTVKKKKEA